MAPIFYIRCLVRVVVCCSHCIQTCRFPIRPLNSCKPWAVMVWCVARGVIDSEWVGATGITPLRGKSKWALFRERIRTRAPLTTTSAIKERHSGIRVRTDPFIPSAISSGVYWEVAGHWLTRYASVSRGGKHHFPLLSLIRPRLTDRILPESRIRSPGLLVRHWYHIARCRFSPGAHFSSVHPFFSPTKGLVTA